MKRLIKTVAAAALVVATAFVWELAGAGRPPARGAGVDAPVAVNAAP